MNLKPSFVGIPTEVRQQIFSYVLVDDVRRNVERRSEKKKRLQVGVLRVNRLFYSEAVEMLYTGNRFHIKVNAEGIAASKTPLLYPMGSMVRNWSITVDFDDGFGFSSSSIPSLALQVRKVFCALSGAKLDKLFVKVSHGNNHRAASKALREMLPPFGAICTSKQVDIQGLRDRELVNDLGKGLSRFGGRDTDSFIQKEFARHLKLVSSNMDSVPIAQTATNKAIISSVAYPNTDTYMKEVLKMLELEYQAECRRDVEYGAPDFQAHQDYLRLIDGSRDWLYARDLFKEMVLDVLPSWCQEKQT